MRLFARAFVVSSSEEGGGRFAFVSTDSGMGSDILNARVIERVAELLGDDSIYRYENLAISGTHSHSGPAGFLQYVLYQVSSEGYVKETADTFVESISQAIVKAHNNLDEGSIEYTTGNQLLDANINRSPYSYLQNPEEERNSYKDGNTDKNMFQLKFKSDAGEELGLFNWFAVHGTSLNNTNQLVSGDNKGLASYYFEKEKNGIDVVPGEGKFVAAFASSNLGDVSPNTQGAICQEGPDAGSPCDFEHSTCRTKNGKNRTEHCWASGPGKDMFESMKIIGTKQYDHARKLYSEDSVKLPSDAPVDYRHSFIRPEGKAVTLESGEVVHTCEAALGYGFAGGTTDGPGLFNFEQGTNSSSKFWNLVGGFLDKPTKEEQACHDPKPILLNTGHINKPYHWDPETIPISIFRIGEVFILNAPGEFTTMSGRRMRKMVERVAAEYGVEDAKVTIAGLTNTYTHYIATFEEYQAQRYEGGSTLYGPHTLSMYLQEYERLLRDMMEGTESVTDVAPENSEEDQWSLLPPVVIDFAPPGKHFGEVLEDANESYGKGEVVKVKFVSANPRNDHRIGDTFLTVLKKSDSGEFETKYVDSDWCTKFVWSGGVGHVGFSHATIEWDIDESLEREQGTYKICHHGNHKGVRHIKEFHGCSSEFYVEA